MISIDGKNETGSPGQKTSVDLTNCDREPIHIPSAIQPHGMLLAAREHDQKIMHVSANSELFLRMPPEEILGRTLKQVLGSDVVAAIAFAKYDLAGIVATRFKVSLPHTPRILHGFLNSYRGMLCIELEPYAEEQRWSLLARRTEEVINGLKQARSLMELCESATAEVRILTGYDHVMLYRFHEDDHGEVIAESHDEHTQGFLHLHFPASDIPAQARALYLLQRTRLIADVNYRAVPVLGHAQAGESKLDMTHCKLRSVSPMHIQYLKNMGVGASFAISLIHNKKLWGMIICHHRTARLMPVEVRSLCDLLGQMVSLLTRVTETKDEYMNHVSYRGKLDLLSTLMPPTLLLAEALAEHTEALLQPVDASGALVRLQGRTQLVGETPDLEDAIAIMDAMRARLGGGVAACESISEINPDFIHHASVASGALMISIKDSIEEGILWFRPEVVKTTLWGGNPEEAKISDEAAGGFHPRESFTAWTQTQFGRSRTWKDVEISLALDFQRILNGALRLRQADRPAQLSNCDTLTNLPNRRALLDRLAQCGSELWESSACLIFIDIDRFKMVNDTMGHQSGDELLIQVAQRLTHTVSPGQMVARLGGDEYVIFCENVSLEEARVVAGKIVQSFQSPFVLKGKPFRCATSIGLALANGRGFESVSDILHAADSAMYAAKQRGGNQFVIFEKPLHEKLLRQVQLEQDLFQAIDRGEMNVHFQAQIAVEDHRLIGFEALLRWRHPAYGNISPVEFIPMAEYTGHIQAIGAWVLRDSLRQIAMWRKKSNSQLFVAVNVSVQQMATNNFADLVDRALKDAGLPSEALHLEVTESMLMETSTECQLEAIQAMGVKIAIDDFGTGYSSLSYLPRLAVSELKLDRTFLEGVGKDERKTALFGAIVSMAHTLNLMVVAEGIEEISQFDCIRQHLCDAAQGYLLSKPISPESVEALLLTEWKDGVLSPVQV